MNGVVYHRIGPLIPSGNSAPKYAQLYMVDSADEVQLRISAFDRQGAETLDPDPGIVASLIAMLNRHHKLVHKFRMARANLCSPSAPRVAIHFMGDEAVVMVTVFLVLLHVRWPLLLSAITRLNVKDLMLLLKLALVFFSISLR